MSADQRNKFSRQRRLFLLNGLQTVAVVPAVLAAAAMLPACTKKEEAVPEEDEGLVEPGDDDMDTSAAMDDDAGTATPATPTEPDEDPKFVTEIPTAKPLVTSLKYEAESSKPGQNCTNCQLYTAQAGVAGGKCTLFPKGYVHANGWCASWVKRSG